MLKVAVAVVVQNNQVLLATRALHKVQGGAWEFPGGKIEADETPYNALVRECTEELAIKVKSAKKLIVTTQSYPEFKVELHAFKITEFIGTPIGAEGQQIKWVNLNNLTNYLFVAADWAIINSAVLPNKYAITPDALPDLVIKHIQKLAAQNFSLVRLRMPNLANNQYFELANHLINNHKHQITFMLRCDNLAINNFLDAGLHLTAKQLAEFSKRPIARGRLLAASVHNLMELEQAQLLEVDFVTLSPVKPTLSHPNNKVLTTKEVTDIMQCAQIPVFWQGGMQISDLEQALLGKAQGIAAIRSFI